MTKAEVRPVGLADPVPDWLFGFGLFLLALLLRLACFTGLIASDDLDYSAYAQLIAEGRYAPKYHHVAIRYGLILPAGLLYGLIGDHRTALRIVALGGVAGVDRGKAVRRSDGTDRRTAARNLPLQLRYATTLEPEPTHGVARIAAGSRPLYTETPRWKSGFSRSRSQRGGLVATYSRMRINSAWLRTTRSK